MGKKDQLQRAWWRMPKPIRQTLVLMVGVSVIVAGLCMLVLPGPGWAAVFLGFAILATEFAFAEKVRDWLIQFVKNLIIYCKRLFHKLVKKH